MSSLFPLEDFGASKPKKQAPEPAAPAQQPPPAMAVDHQAEKMAAYEKGYKAGWDDAAAAQSDDESRIGAEFARNLQDLGFTFHEARNHVMRAMEPLLSEIVSKVLPSVVSETIGQTIIEELLPLAETASDTPIEIVIAPGSRESLETLLDENIAVPITIVEEETLADGQVYLRMGSIERHIDMTTTVDKIGHAIQAVYELNDKAMTHG